MQRRATGAVVLLGLLALGACTRTDPVTFLVLDETPLRSADGEIRRALRVGEEIVLQGGSLFDRGRNDLWFLANDDVVRKGPALVPMPPPVERRFAQPRGAVILRYNTSTQRHDGVRRLKAREPVDVVPHPTAARLVCIKDGAVEGTIDARSVERQPATAARMFERARTLFVAGDHAQARWFAEQVQAIDPKHLSAARMAAALRIEQGEEEGWRAWAKVKPSPLPRVPPTKTATTGQAAYVIASKLTLRDGPSRKAASLSLLPFGTEVRVERIKGEWAKVAVRDVVLRSHGARELGDFSLLSTAGLLAIDELVVREVADTRPAEADAGSEDEAASAPSARPAVDAGAPDGGAYERASATARADQGGWVSAAFLDQHRPEVGDLLRDAEAAKKRGAHELAIVLFERLAAAQRGTRAWSMAIDEAIAAERWRRALVLMKERSQADLGAERAPFEVTIDRYAGCKGDLLGHEVRELDPYLPPAAIDVEAALDEEAIEAAERALDDEEASREDDFEGDDAPPAPPPMSPWPESVCITRLVDELWCEPQVPDPEIGLDVESMGEDELRELHEEHDRMVSGAATTTRRVRAAEAKRKAAFKAIVVEQTGDTIERFVIRLDNTSERDAAPGKVMVVYTAARAVDGYCGSITDEGYEDVRARYFRAPTVAGGSQLDLWFKGGAHTVGVAFASSEAAAKAFVEEELTFGHDARAKRAARELREEQAQAEGLESEVFGRVEVSDPLDTCDVDACGC